MDKMTLEATEGKIASGLHVHPERLKEYYKIKGIKPPKSWKEKCEELEKWHEEDASLIVKFAHDEIELRECIKELEGELETYRDYLNSHNQTLSLSAIDDLIADKALPTEEVCEKNDCPVLSYNGECRNCSKPIKEEV